MEKPNTVPRHVAIILDGNGRWAAKRKMPRNYGHAQGSKNVETICRAADEVGIEYMTFYAFSTENWNRPKDEVDALMKLLDSYMKDSIRMSMKNNMRVRIIGERTKLGADMQKRIIDLEEASKNNTGLTMQIALNYGGRDDIIRAVKKIAERVEKGELSSSQITEQMFSNYLDTAGVPDPDLLIRTSGEYRISNFLLWQSAYTEFYSTDIYWPDFKKKDLMEAIAYYNRRERRFGGL